MMTRTGTVRRARAQLPALHSSVGKARRLITEWLLTWSRERYGLGGHPGRGRTRRERSGAHSERTQPRCRSRGETLTIAVEDNSHTPATRREHPGRGGDTVSGLAVVAALSRTWGSTPTSTGKTVRAVLDPERVTSSRE